MLGQVLATGQVTSNELADHPLLIVSEVRLLREGIAGAIEGKSNLSVVALCENLTQALTAVREHPGATVLFDASFPKGLEAVRQIRAIHQGGLVVVFGVPETEENVIDWAKARASGYVPTTTPLSELVLFIECIIRGEQICSATIAARLMRRVGSSAQREDQNPQLAMSLTTREHEITQMIAEGFSNKEIARRLKIELSTTKSHVHNLLGKLGLQRRGQIAHWGLTQPRHPN